MRTATVSVMGYFFLHFLQPVQKPPKILYTMKSLHISHFQRAAKVGSEYWDNNSSIGFCAARCASSSQLGVTCLRQQ